MKTTHLGEVARRQRKALGVPQEMVCEGLCTAMTLSRFESGRQTPSRDCVIAILQRLGLPGDRYYAQLTGRETRLLRLREEALAYCSQFERSLGEERQQARIGALQKLHDIECFIKEDDHINQQFIMRIRATVEEHPPQEQLAMLIDALRLTSPRFNPNRLDNCLYCEDELTLISQIAIRHALCGQRESAINIYQQLLELVQKRYPDHDCLHLIAYNYSLHLAGANRLDEALEISELGRCACIKHGYFCMLPRFLHIQVGCYYLMGKTSQSAELYRSAYHIYGATMNTKDQESLKRNFKEHSELIL